VLQFIILDLIILLILALIIFLVIIKLRRKMLTLWQEVSRLELIFHHKLFEILKVYLAHENVLTQYNEQSSIEVLKQYKKPKLRTLALKDRQSIFKALQTLYVAIDVESHPATLTLKHGFESLQSCRLKYNSKVLYYNQYINVFPTKFLAKRMNFEEKEYFG